METAVGIAFLGLFLLWLISSAYLLGYYLMPWLVERWLRRK